MIRYCRFAAVSIYLHLFFVEFLCRFTSMCGALHEMWWARMVKSKGAHNLSIFIQWHQSSESKERDEHFFQRDVTQTESYIAREHTKMLARTTSTCKNKSEQKRKNNLRWLATINVNIPSMCRFVRVSWLYFFYGSLSSFISISFLTVFYFAIYLTWFTHTKPKSIYPMSAFFARPKNLYIQLLCIHIHLRRHTNTTAQMACI